MSKAATIASLVRNAAKEEADFVATIVEIFEDDDGIAYTAAWLRVSREHSARCAASSEDRNGAASTGLLNSRDRSCDGPAPRTLD